MQRCINCGLEFREASWKCPGCGFAPRVVEGIPVFAPELAALNDKFPPESFDRLAALEAQHFWFRARNKLILWALRQYAPSMQSFLEIGCGTGFALSAIEQAFPDAAVSGCEIYTRGLGQARRRMQRAQLYQLDATTLPFSAEFDVVGLFDVLEHIENHQAVVDAVARALTPNGLLLITVPQHRWLWSHVDEYSRHVRRYTQADVRSLLVSSGFEILRMTSFVSLLLPVMALSRFRQKSARESFDPAAELRIDPTLNRIFEAIMTVERAIIHRGLDLRAGGSLLVCARKTRVSGR